jgi:hypothetical protein
MENREEGQAPVPADVGRKQPVSRTTDDDDLINRFLVASEKRVAAYGNRIPLNSKDARLAIAWLRSLVGYINDDGSLT